jgi:3-dehydroquinate dehydratase-2
MSGKGARHRVEVMHGVNLDQLGHRDPALYGTLTLPELEALATEHGAALGLEVSCFQSNHEGEFVERLHALRESADGLVINPGAWTHYSWAIRDALEIAALPAVEVHLSNPMQREEWRHVSVLGGLCFQSVRGRGPEGYRDALQMLGDRLNGETR